MPPELDDATLAQLPPDFQVEVAHLSAGEHAQVVDAVEAAAASGDLHGFDVDHAISEAQQAQLHRDNVEDIHQQQADAVAAGDYAKAADLAHDAQWEVRSVADHGGEADSQLIQAQHDDANLHEAAWEQATAHDQGDWAAHHAAAGDADHAAGAADSAADHASAADAYAGHADQGGHYADHSYDSAASTGDGA